MYLPDCMYTCTISDEIDMFKLKNFFFRPEDYSNKLNAIHRNYLEAILEAMLLFLVLLRSQIFDAFLKSFWT